MVESPTHNVFIRGGKGFARLFFLSCVGLLTVAFSGLPFSMAIAEPIVILEYRGAEIIADGYGGTHPFRMDPDYSTHHKSCRMKH